MRVANIQRNTAETRISLKLNIDGSGICDINSGSGFLDHMLTLFAKHGRFDITLNCIGDTEVDLHHSAEDIGICLGLAFKEALGDKRGMVRYGNMILPMDETLILSAVDFSGRAFLSYQTQIRAKKVGEFDVELAEEFWLSFVRNCQCTLHIKQLDGKNAHHILEGIFKSVARSFKAAVMIEEKYKDQIPSSKGVL